MNVLQTTFAITVWCLAPLRFRGAALIQTEPSHALFHSRASQPGASANSLYYWVQVTLVCFTGNVLVTCPILRGRLETKRVTRARSTVLLLFVLLG